MISNAVFAGNIFKRKSHMRRHVQYNHSDTPSALHKCQFCHKEFKLKCNMTRPVNVIHKKIFKFQCEECDEQLASKVQVLAHKRAKHGSLKLRCSNCNVTFTYVQNLNKHEKNIGLTHVFSCINICWVPWMLFEHEAYRPSVQTASEGPGKC